MRHGSSGCASFIGILSTGFPIFNCSDPMLLRLIGLVVPIEYVGHAVVQLGRLLVALGGPLQRPCGVLVGLVNVLSSVRHVVGARSRRRALLFELPASVVQLLDPLADLVAALPQLGFQLAGVDLFGHSPDPPCLASDKRRLAVIVPIWPASSDPRRWWPP